MIPYHSDAPLYHWPIATGLLIGLSSLLFFLVPGKYLESQPQPRSVPRDGLAGGQDNGGGAGQQARGAGRPNELERDANWDADAFRIVEEPDGNDQAGGQGVRGFAPIGAQVDVPMAAQPIGQGAQPVGKIGQGAQPVGKMSRGAAIPITLALEHGAGLKPWQWLSSLFLHDNLWQLLMNMVVLWAFGMVVEGKVGGLVFLGIYLGIGMTQAGVEQLLTVLAPPTVSLGANAALLGLLGIAVVWAPRNEFDVLWGWGMRISSIEVPILLYGFVQFALELMGIAFGQWGVSISLLHMLGLLMGLSVGWVWLRRGWVDCEGWDLINVWRGKEATVDEDHQLADEARQLVRSTARGLSSPAPTAKPVVKTATARPTKGHGRTANTTSKNNTTASSDSFRERLGSDRASRCRAVNH